MDTQDIQRLLQIKKKGESSKTEKKSFHDAWLDYVEKNGFDDTAESFLYAGFSFMGILPYISYLEKLPDKTEAIRKLMVGKSYYKNKSITFKVMLHLLAMFIIKWPSELIVISSIIQRLPALSVNKENKKLGDITKSIYKYFIQVLSPESTLPPINGLRSNDPDSFCSMMVDSLDSLVAECHCSASELATIYRVGHWLKINENTDIGVPSSGQSSCEPSSVSTLVKSDKANSPTKKAEDIFASIDAKTQTWRDNLNSINISTKKLERNLLQLQEDNARLSSENSRIMKEHANTCAVLKSEQENCEYLRTEKRCLTAEVSSLHQQVDTLEKIICEKESKIVEYGKLTDMLNKDRTKQADEAFNRLASKLRVDYRDFLSSTNLPMSTDLGNIMRFQLKSIFDLLKKNGFNLD